MDESQGEKSKRCRNSENDELSVSEIYSGGSMGVIDKWIWNQETWVRIRGCHLLACDLGHVYLICLCFLTCQVRGTTYLAYCESALYYEQCLAALTSVPCHFCFTVEWGWQMAAFS